MCTDDNNQYSAYLQSSSWLQTQQIPQPMHWLQPQSPVIIMWLENIIQVFKKKIGFRQKVEENSLKHFAKTPKRQIMNLFLRSNMESSGLPCMHLQG